LIISEIIQQNLDFLEPLNIYKVNMTKILYKSKFFIRFILTNYNLSYILDYR
jgi:hypothetical protein